jgi:hypothetical protein
MSRLPSNEISPLRLSSCRIRLTCTAERPQARRKVLPRKREMERSILRQAGHFHADRGSQIELGDPSERIARTQTGDPFPLDGGIDQRLAPDGVRQAAEVCQHAMKKPMRHDPHSGRSSAAEIMVHDRMMQGLKAR